MDEEKQPVVEEKERKYKYIGVVFLNKNRLNENGEPTFDENGTHYTYKTLDEYKKYQLVTVPTKFGVSKAVVLDEDIPEDTIKYPLEGIVEI